MLDTFRFVRQPLQVTFDASSPKRLGEFWMAVLNYIEQPPPKGFATWEEALDAFGVDRSDPDRAFAIVDPTGNGPRLYFQRVPEGKTSKNRVHLDIDVGKNAMNSRARELVERGARIVAEIDEPGGHFISMIDPEGNEFCLQ